MQGPGALRAWVAAVGLCAVCAAEACLCCLCPCAPLLPCRQACVEAGRLREQVAGAAQCGRVPVHGMVDVAAHLTCSTPGCVDPCPRPPRPCLCPQMSEVGENQRQLASAADNKLLNFGGQQVSAVSAASSALPAC